MLEQFELLINLCTFYSRLYLAWGGGWGVSTEVLRMKQKLCIIFLGYTRVEEVGGTLVLG